MFFHQGCAHFVEGNWFARFVLRRFVKQTLNELALIVDCSTRIRNHDFSEIICCDSKSALRATLAGLEMAVRTVFFRCTNESKKKKKKCEVGKETNRSQRYQFKCKIRTSCAQTMDCFVLRRAAAFATKHQDVPIQSLHAVEFAYPRKTCICTNREKQ